MGKPLSPDQREFINRFIAKTDGGPGAGNIDYKKLRQSWDDARKQVGESLKLLEQAILASFADSTDLDVVRVGVRQLDVIMETLGSDLQDILCDALNAPDAEKPAIHRDALSIIADYREYLDGDEFVSGVQDNPHSVDVLGPLSQALADIGTALAI
jgi:hypothetical protein